MKLMGIIGLATVLGALGCSAAADEDAQSEADEIKTKTAFRVPILDANTKRPLAEHNAALRAKGAETFPEFLDIDVARLSSFEHMFDVVDAANKALGTSLELLGQASPLELAKTAKNPHGLCYVGSARAIATLMRDLNDSVFDEFIAVYMWKFHGETHRGEAFGSTGPEDVSKFPQAFARFHGNGDDVMMVFSATDAFDERLAATIPRCVPDKK